MNKSLMNLEEIRRITRFKMLSTVLPGALIIALLVYFAPLWVLIPAVVVVAYLVGNNIYSEEVYLNTFLDEKVIPFLNSRIDAKFERTSVRSWGLFLKEKKIAPFYGLFNTHVYAAANVKNRVNVGLVHFKDYRGFGSLLYAIFYVDRLNVRNRFKWKKLSGRRKLGRFIVGLFALSILLITVLLIDAFPLHDLIIGTLRAIAFFGFMISFALFLILLTRPKDSAVTMPSEIQELSADFPEDILEVIAAGRDQSSTYVVVKLKNRNFEPRLYAGPMVRAPEEWDKITPCFQQIIDKLLIREDEAASWRQ